MRRRDFWIRILRPRSGHRRNPVMPNLLAHFGAQGIASQPALRTRDSLWVVTGCVIPDVPWILQRILLVLAPGVDIYDLRLYSIAQASLLFSLLLAGTVALVSHRPRRTWAILAIGVILHLLLDALETKWANGVHLFAPFSWELVNVGLFWPESVTIQIITLLGFGYLVWIVRSWLKDFPESVPRIRLSRRALMSASAVLMVYLAGPVLFLSGPRSADNHYVATLRNERARPGRYVEFDRNLLRKTGAGYTLTSFAGETLRVEGADGQSSGTVSLRGIFKDERTVQALDLHRHSTLLRDGPSYLALLLIGAMWFITVHGVRSAGER